MAKPSAGILVYRLTSDSFEMLLAHPGGPYWANKDAGMWSVPKGQFEDGESPLDAGKREFNEEVGFPVPDGELIDLGIIKQASGKKVYVWAVEGDIDVSQSQSNRIDIEWPPRSGKMIEVPEIDRVEWCDPQLALARFVTAQAEFVYRLADYLKRPVS